MFLVVLIVVLSLIGMVYGFKNENKKTVVVSIIALVLLAIMLLAYAYFYSKNPY